MGNTEGNSLPRCQLEQIVEFLRPLPWTPIASTNEEQENDKCWKMHLPSKSAVTPEKSSSQPLYFWVDTICVPKKPDTLHKEALEEMRKVYNRANRVLVIDTDLTSIQLEPQLDTYDRHAVMNSIITASSWQQRLWTLQEAVLAKKLWVQFASGACERISGFARLKAEIRNILDDYYDNELGYYSEETDYEGWHVDTTKWDNPEVLKITMVLQSLKTRTTSYPADIPLCIAILLDLDIKELQSVSDDDRTRKVWSMLPAFPAGLLCFPCRKLEIDHFRWAAASMDDCTIFGTPVGHPAYVSPWGVVKVKLFGFMIDLVRDRIPRAVIPIEVNGKIAYVRQNLKNGNLPWNSQNSTVFPCAPARIGFIIGGEPEASPTEAVLRGCLAAMVSIVPHDQNQSPHHDQSKSEENSSSSSSSSTLVVNYLRAVSVFAQGGYHDRHGSTPWTKEELEEKQIEPVATTFLGADQSWTIVPHGHNGDRVLE